MSNPAVILLASTYIGGTEVRIEDNWAESIHFHFGMLRIDLTIDEFLDIADKMADAANEIIGAHNFDIRDFDPIFLNYYSAVLADLESVTIDKVKLSELIILKNNKLPVYRHLNQSRDYKALTGNADDLNNYTTQVNLIGQSNMERLKGILDSIKQCGYPYHNEYIILRNEQNVLLDGQHRASCLLYLYGPEHTVPVMRFHFKDNKYDVTDWHPWIRAIYRKIINLLRNLSHKISGGGQIDV